jgi:hypothetical protein
MPQYAILIYEKELPGGFADIPPEVMEANLAVGDKISAMGARVVNEQALQPVATRPGHRGGHREAAADHGRGRRGAAAASRLSAFPQGPLRRRRDGTA